MGNVKDIEMVPLFDDHLPMNHKHENKQTHSEGSFEAA